MDKYYDKKSKTLYDLPSFKLEGGQVNQVLLGGRMHRGTTQPITVTFDASNFEINYVRMLMDIFQPSNGYMMLKADVVRDIVIMKESGELLELRNCQLLNMSMYDDESAKCELEFCADYQILHIDNSDTYYEILRQIRAEKLDKLL